MLQPRSLPRTYHSRFRRLPLYTRRMNPRLSTALSVLAVVVLSVVIIAGFGYMLARLHTVTTIVVGAIFLCYALYPSIERLSMRLPMWAAILLVYALLIAVIATGLSIVVPAISNN